MNIKKKRKLIIKFTDDKNGLIYYLLIYRFPKLSCVIYI